MHQPAAFCGGIAEMRKKEGCGKAIFVRDMFAGGLSGSCKRMSSQMRVLGRSWMRMRAEDGDEQPERLLKAARMCGWLSYRADPVRKFLIRCDEEDWMKGREKDLPEKSQRHPQTQRR